MKLVIKYIFCRIKVKTKHSHLFVTAIVFHILWHMDFPGDSKSSFQRA